MAVKLWVGSKDGSDILGRNTSMASQESRIGGNSQLVVSECSAISFFSQKLMKQTTNQQLRSLFLSILQFDHHCVWLNNCVGYNNYRAFLLTLFYLSVGCWYGFFMLFGSILPPFFWCFLLFFSITFSRLFYECFFLVFLIVLGTARTLKSLKIHWF